jgi:1-phosphatidylinositol phosphodiesterase
VVVGAWEFPSTVSSWIQQNTPFWSNAVHQYWCGESVTTWSYVANYLQTTLNGFTEPQNELTSLMAQYNYSTQQSVTAYGVPVNIPVELSNFFAGSNGLQANIIATDWWNRVNATTGQQELNINNFSALINAVPFNLLKGYRSQNNQPLW